MRTIILILLLSLFSLTGFSQSTSPYSIGLFSRTLFQPQANTGFQLGVSVHKRLKNEKTGLQFQFLRSLNTISSNEGLGYDVFHMTYGSVGITQHLAQLGPVQFRGQLSLVLGASEQRIRTYPDLETFSPYAIFALEPGIRVSIPLGENASLFTGTAYLLQFSQLFPTDNLESVSFNRPMWDAGFSWNF